MTYDAILLTSFGGPEGPAEVMPYLERVTAGRGIPRERLEEVSHHYLKLGGVSPINAQNRELLAKLRQRFPERGIDIPVYWGNRNSAPYMADVVREMYEDGHRNVLAWVTSAYSSYSGCRQYRENLHQALAENELIGKMTIDKVRPYFDHPGFLAPMVEGLHHSVNAMGEIGLQIDDVRILFSTHSIPDSMAETSGPSLRRADFEAVGGAYTAQHLVAAAAIIDEIRSAGIDVPDWNLVYQSRSGSPTVPWLEPDVNDAIRDAADTGVKGVIVVPLGFVSDHVEVVWDLDNEARETAAELGLAFDRVATAGAADVFVDGIADLVLERMSSFAPKSLTDLGPWPGVCAVGCCPNLRRDLPVIAEESDSV